MRAEERTAADLMDFNVDIHKSYSKVHRLEKDECEGLLEGRVHIFEKLDGANGSVWVDSEGRLCVSSRRNQLARGDEVTEDFLIMGKLLGFVSYVQKSEPIRELLKLFPHLRLFGEWLIKHTVNYPVEHLNKFYVFDVYDQEEQKYLPYSEYAGLLETLGVPYLAPLEVHERPTHATLEALLGQSRYGAMPCGEGIVLKNYNFVNRWGEILYGKLVTKDFREVRSVTRQTARKDDVESRIAAQYLTPARVQKIMAKHDLGEMSDLPKLFGLIYNDVITEDIWDILKRYKKPVIDFKKLDRHLQTAAKSYYIEILQEQVAS